MTRVIPIRTGVRFHLVFPAKAARPTPQTAFVLEHVLGLGIDGPVVAFARLPESHSLRNLDETLVETEIVANGVLPADVLTTKEVESTSCKIDSKFRKKLGFDLAYRFCRYV